MLSTINWQTYWTATGIILALYYLLILSLFYQKEMLALLTGQRTKAKTPTSSPPSQNLMGAIREDFETDTEPETKQSETLPQEELEFSDGPSPDDPYGNEAAQSDAFDALEQVSQEIKSLMISYGKKGNRTELLRLIQKRLIVFAQVNDAASFKESLNNFITGQCSELCGIRLEPADLKALWLKEPL